MGRRRRPFNGVEDIIPRRSRFSEDLAPMKLGTRQRNRWKQSESWSYKVANGVYDPLTYMFVLDTVAGIDPDIELRAGNLAKHLNVYVEQFSWDPVTVGRVLVDLGEAFEDVLGPKMGLLERGQDYRGAFYNIHLNADTVGLYYRLREDLMRLAEDEMTRKGRGDASKRLASPLLECPSVRGEFSDPNAV